jgi:hypothetical protein
VSAVYAGERYAWRRIREWSSEAAEFMPELELLQHQRIGVPDWASQ